MKSYLLTASVELIDRCKGWGSFAGIVSTALRVTIGIIFCVSGLLKIVNHDEFMAALKTYGFFSPLVIEIAVVVMPHLEIVVGGLVAFDVRTKMICLVLALLLVTLSLVGAAAILQGRAVDCGCFPLAESSESIGAGYFIRNAMLTAVCLWIAFRSQASDDVEHSQRQSAGFCEGDYTYLKNSRSLATNSELVSRERRTHL